MLKVKRYIKQWFPVVFYLLVTAACSEEDSRLAGEEGEARIPLKVSTLRITSDPNASEDERLIRSIFVLIYNTVGRLENAGKTEVIPSSDSSQLVDADGNINQTWLVYAGEKNIYVVINPPDILKDNLRESLTIEQLRALIARDFSIYENGLVNRTQGGLMTGHVRTRITTTSSAAEVPVKRRYARVDLYLRKSPELASVETRITKVELKNYSSEVILFDPASAWGESTEGSPQSITGSQDVTTTESYVRFYDRNFYIMPRPVRVSLDRGIPTLEITASIAGKTQVYTAYLAELDADKRFDLSRPFPVEGNTIFRLNATLTPLKEDVKVNLTVLPWEEEVPQEEHISGDLNRHANCFLVSPGGNIRFGVNSVYKIWGWLLGDVIPEDKPITAEIIWSDTPDLISSVTLEKGYNMTSHAIIRVKTTDTAKKGNAVIGMKVEGESSYRWSWHIWVTEGYNPYPTNRGVEISTLNLGAVTQSDAGLLYQWGRKDPFPNALDGNEPRLYGKTAADHPQIQYVPVADENNMNNSIRNPLTFYTSVASPFDWYTTEESKQNATLWQDKDNLKSIYDPCPYGWRVVTRDVWAYLNYTWVQLDGVKSLAYYFNLTGCLFVCAGYRDGTTGSLAKQNEEVRYWDSSKTLPQANSLNGTWENILYPYPATTNYLPANRANGYSVRCVKMN